MKLQTPVLIKKQMYPPGDFGIWIVIYMELITFGALFIGYAFARRNELEVFNESQLLLNKGMGFINTLVLITSSWFVVMALQSIKNYQGKEAQTKASNWLGGAIGLGLVFMLIKILEISSKYEQGINLSTNTFFMFYIILIAFHFLHVLLGIIILFNLRQATLKGEYTQDNHVGMQTGASYWHLVDLLWIVLFPLIYLMR